MLLTSHDTDFDKENRSAIKLYATGLQTASPMPSSTLRTTTEKQTRQPRNQNKQRL